MFNYVLYYYSCIILISGIFSYLIIFWRYQKYTGLLIWMIPAVKLCITSSRVRNAGAVWAGELAVPTWRQQELPDTANILGLANTSVHPPQLQPNRIVISSCNQLCNCFICIHIKPNPCIVNFLYWIFTKTSKFYLGQKLNQKFSIVDDIFARSSECPLLAVDNVAKWASANFIV